MKLTRSQLRKIIIESTTGAYAESNIDDLEKSAIDQLNSGKIVSNQFLRIAMDPDPTGYPKIVIALGVRNKDNIYPFSSEDVAEKFARAINDAGGFLGTEFQVSSLKSGRVSDFIVLEAVSGLPMGSLPDSSDIEFDPRYNR